MCSCCQARAGWGASLLLAISMVLGGADSANAALVYRLQDTNAVAGSEIFLQGLLANDTGNPLDGAVAKELHGIWTDSQGRTTPAYFQLRSSPDAVNLPVNTFTQMLWSTQVPSDADGLLTLRLESDTDTLLALQVKAYQNHATATGQTAEPGMSERDSANMLAPAGHNEVAVVQNTEPASSPFEIFRNAISPYEPIYFALGSRGGANARFQISFKYRLLSPKDPGQSGFMNDWYLGYTQTSLWDLHSDSIPFVDTTYNPSVFWMREALWSTNDNRWSLGLNAGLEHKSNGKDGADSRSINDLYLQPQLDYRFSGGSLISLQPRFKHYVWTDKSMRYADSLGHIDWKLRWAQDNGLSLSAMYRQGRGGRNATELSATWPLKRTFIGSNGYLYVQYFRGYGETLLAYQQKHAPQLRIGIALVP